MGILYITNQPAYFDSQASAAAALKIDIYDLRQAKREGCPAFRSGRVYRDELLDWLAKRPKRSWSRVGSDEPEIFAFSWEDRREVLFELKDFICDVYQRKEIPFREFQKLITGTALLIVKLGQLWKADIDEHGFLADCAWLSVAGNYPQRDSETK